MANIWSIAVIVGPLLLLAAIIYAWQRNRRAPPSVDRQAEQGARELRDEIAHEPEKRSDS